jgi:hypothetical protein
MFFFNFLKPKWKFDIFMNLSLFYPLHLIFHNKNIDINIYLYVYFIFICLYIYYIYLAVFGVDSGPCTS